MPHVILGHSSLHTLAHLHTYVYLIVTTLAALSRLQILCITNANEMRWVNRNAVCFLCKIVLAFYCIGVEMLCGFALLMTPLLCQQLLLTPIHCIRKRFNEHADSIQRMLVTLGVQIEIDLKKGFVDIDIMKYRVYSVRGNVMRLKFFWTIK